MLLKIIQFCMPEFIKKKKLNELFRLTADAFQSDLPELRGFSFTECLPKYAIFTKGQAESYLQSGRPLEEVKHRLYQNSYIFGQNMRKSLHILTWKEAVTVLKVVYKFIGIDFHYNRQGEIIIRQCFFSKYYSGEICKLISSLDIGLAAGLSGGGRLFFNQRIAEGNNCCKGFLYRGL
ncbi:MAG: hypothetical protein IMZ47_07830 [Firmicutes bacterium]|nr:hypothetical protein [Bacillota bacterium]